MGAQKKGKSSRLARMSEEERARYLQHRAALEEEARRRKQQLLAAFLRCKLRREDDFARLNAAKINQQWRALLRAAKADDLLVELRAASEAFQGTVLRQDAAVRRLEADLRAAELQYARGLQAHADAIDRLMALYEQRLHEQHEQFRAAREDAVRRARARQERVRASAAHAASQLRVATFLNKQELHAFCAERAARHQAAADDLRYTLMAEYESMTAEGDGAMERLWRALRQTLRSYAAATDDRRLQLRRLQQRDADHAAAAAQLDRRAARLQEQSEGLRRRLREVLQSARDEGQRLQAERAQMAASQADLRARLLRATAADKRRLHELASCSGHAIEELRRVETKAAKVLTLAELCRRLETEEEKVAPWGLYPPLDDELGDLKEAKVIKEAKVFKEAVDFKKAKEFKEALDFKEAKDFKEAVDFKEALGFKDAKDFKEAVDFKEALDFKEAKDFKEAVDFKEALDFKDAKDFREAVDFKEALDFKEAVDFKETKEFKEAKEFEEVKDFKEFKEVKELKERKEAKERKKTKDFKEDHMEDLHMISGRGSPPLKPDPFLDVKGRPPLGALERFWLRFNGALLSLASLRAQKEDLTADVRSLRRALRGCLAALAPSSKAASAAASAAKAPKVEGERARTAVPAARRHLVALPGSAAPAAGDAPAAAKRRPATCVEAATCVAVRFPIAASGAW